MKMVRKNAAFSTVTNAYFYGVSFVVIVVVIVLFCCGEGGCQKQDATGH